jgi:thiosulfate/3-mercaptopyruvate sulfurtransferase
MKRLKAIILGSILIWAMPGYRQFSNPAVAPLSAGTVPKARQMQPVDLAEMLKAGKGERPQMLQVGSHVMFEQAHIPGSLYAVPGSQAAGLHLLEKAVASMPKGKLIVLYCGCCPWNRCPNVARHTRSCRTSDSRI